MAPETIAPRPDAAGGEDEVYRMVRHRIQEQRAAHAAILATSSGAGSRIIAVRDPGSSDDYILGGDTIFEIASLSKIFTALLFAVEVVNNRLRLDDPLQDHVPPGVQAPVFEGHQITLMDLATHGSGLPLRPSNLATSAPDALDKYAGYTLEQLYAALPNYRLTRAPGARFEYSNLAYAVLGQGIAFREGRPFADVLRERVLDPLGLDDTSLDDDPANARRRAQGHSFDLEPVGMTSDGALSPASGLRSSARDLLKLIDLFLSQKGPEDLVTAARIMLSFERPGDDDSTRMVLGWRKTIMHGETYYWSNGSGDGSRTFMGFNPARGTGVVALADAASGAGLDDIGRRQLDPLQEVDTTVIPPLDFVSLPEEVLARAIGRYEYAPDDSIEISPGLTGLILTAGTAQIVIRPLSPTRYASQMAPGALIEFEGAEAGSASALILHEGDETYVYRRAP